MTFHIVAKTTVYPGAGRQPTVSMKRIEAAGEFDTVGMALAHAEFLDRSLPFVAGVAVDVLVYDSMGGVWLPGDEWAELIDTPTERRLFPYGFDADRDYGRRYDEAVRIFGGNPLREAA